MISPRGLKSPEPLEAWPSKLQRRYRIRYKLLRKLDRHKIALPLRHLQAKQVNQCQHRLQHRQRHPPLTQLHLARRPKLKWPLSKRNRKRSSVINVELVLGQESAFAIIVAHNYHSSFRSLADPWSRTHKPR